MINEIALIDKRSASLKRDPTLLNPAAAAADGQLLL